MERVPADELGRPREEALRRALDGKDVRAFALSVVQFSNGYLADVHAFGRLCRSRDILYCLDGIQALGAVPLDVGDLHVDVLASGGQKWLCSPWGSGFAYIRPDLHERFDPPMVSWLAKADAEDFSDLLRYRRAFLPDGRKFELGTLGIQDYVGMARAVGLLLEVGVERIHRHVQEVLEPLARWVAGSRHASSVTPLESERRGGIFTFRLPESEDVHRKLGEAGFTLALREGALRVSPHVYNTVEEMIGLVERLAELCD